MKKLGYVVAALGVIAIAAPSIASAETVVIKHRHHDDWRARHVEMHNGWRHHDHAKVVIKKND